MEQQQRYGHRHFHSLEAASSRPVMFVLGAAVLLGFLTGCQTPTASGPRVIEKTVERYAPMRQGRVDIAVFTDKALRQLYGDRTKVVVRSSGKRRTDSEVLEAWVELHNRSRHPLQVEARTSFYGEGQEPMEGPTAWHRVFLPPNSIGMYREFATKRSTAYYYIEIRQGR